VVCGGIEGGIVYMRFTLQGLGFDKIGTCSFSCSLVFAAYQTLGMECCEPLPLSLEKKVFVGTTREMAPAVQGYHQCLEGSFLDLNHVTFLAVRFFRRPFRHGFIIHCSTRCTLDVLSGRRT
jgi:hypothetical protein